MTGIGHNSGSGSRVLGIDSIDRRVAAFERHTMRAVGLLLEAEARHLQADVVSAIGVHTGTVRATLGSGDAVEVTRNGDGHVTRVRFGFLTKQSQKDGFYYLWVETGRDSGTKEGRRRAGRTKAGAIKYRKITRTVGHIRPRNNFLIAFAKLQQRMAVLRTTAKVGALAAAAFED